MRYEILFRHLPDMLTVPQAAKELRIGKNQAYELIRQGKLMAISVGRKLIVPKTALIEFCKLDTNYLLLLPNPPRFGRLSGK
ncbi:MAG: helix-turn-helix domain-containing protein [Ruminococcus sp.]|nr:helix-turn-helix domain-containing protein [Ruminococcus sp.]MBP3793357.1 helix-turn-helix domain-containing protein [Ruminococcus sp.]